MAASHYTKSLNCVQLTRFMHVSGLAEGSGGQGASQQAQDPKRSRAMRVCICGQFHPEFIHSLMHADHPPCPHECVQQLMQCARSCAIAVLMLTERSHSVCFQVVPHAVKSSAHMERAGWQVYLRTQLSNSTACSSGPLHAAGNRPLNGIAGDHGDSNCSKCSSPCASGSTEPANRCNLSSRRQNPAATCAPPAQQAYDAAVADYCCRLYIYAAECYRAATEAAKPAAGLHPARCGRSGRLSKWQDQCRVTSPTGVAQQPASSSDC